MLKVCWDDQHALITCMHAGENTGGGIINCFCLRFCLIDLMDGHIDTKATVKRKLNERRGTR